MLDMLTGCLRETADMQLLRYAVGRQIFCPICEKVLDVSNAVLTEKPTACLCGDCFDGIADTVRWRFDPDPYGHHGMSEEDREAEGTKRVRAIVDLDGRDFNWDE